MGEKSLLEVDDFSALDALGSGSVRAEDGATRMVRLPPASVMKDMKRAREAGVSLASTQIEPLPDSPKAVLYFSDGRRPETVTKSVFIIGRSREVCDVAVPEDDQVSRQHAAILFASGEFFLEDLHSTNGTFAEDQRVQRIRLESEVPLRVGSLVMTLRWEM